MSPLPPRSTRTATLFPYTTLFRSDDHIAADDAVIDQLGGSGVAHDEQRRHVGALHAFSKFDEDLPAIIEHTHRPPVGPIPVDPIAKIEGGEVHTRSQRRIARPPGFGGPPYDELILRIDPRHRGHPGGRSCQPSQMIGAPYSID